MKISSRKNVNRGRATELDSSQQNNMVAGLARV